MKTRSETFLHEPDVMWQPAGKGVERQIMGYDGQIMIVKVKFEAGAEASLHSHYHSQVSYVVSGKFEYIVGDESRILAPGDTAYVEPDVPHNCKCIDAGILLDCFTPMRADFIK